MPSGPSPPATPNKPHAILQRLADAKERGIAERTLRRAFKGWAVARRRAAMGNGTGGLDSQLGQQDDHQPP